MNKIERWNIHEICILLEDKSPQEIKELHFFEDYLIQAGIKLFGYLKKLNIQPVKPVTEK